MSEKMKLKPLSVAEVSQEELIDMEDEIGLTLADYFGDDAKKPPLKVSAGLLWIAARRVGPKEITWRDAVRNFEFIAETDDDPKDEPPVDTSDNGSPGT